MAAVAEAAKFIGASATAAASGWGAVKLLKTKLEARRRLAEARNKSFATIDKLAEQVASIAPVVTAMNVNVREVREAVHHLQHEKRITSEMIGVGFMRTDPHGEVISVDRMILHITGRSPEELMGRNWYSAIAVEDRDRVVDALTNSVRNRTEVRIEFALVCLRNLRTNVKMYSRPRVSSGGELLEFTLGFQAV